jgi:type I restriction enzyme, S subunit
MAGEPFEPTTFAELISEGALEIGDGYRAKNEELGGEGVIFLRAGHVTDTHIDLNGVERFRIELEPRVRSKMAKAGDAVITTKGNSTGRTAYISASMPSLVYSPHLSYWRSLDVKRVEGRFLHYWSEGTEFKRQLAGMKASTDMAPYLSLVDQKRLHISLPLIDEQRAIAHILGSLDDKIEVNRRMNETLELMGRALFKSWFVDFDPVRANADERTTKLPRHIAELFPDRFTESELGEIPEGWRVGSIYDTADVIYGAPFASARFNADGVGMPLIRIRDLTNETPEMWTTEVHPKAYMVRVGDVVVGMDGEFRAYLWGGAPGWLNQRVCVFAPKPGWSSAFVRNSITDVLAHIEATETATTVIHLGKTDIDRFRIVLPADRVARAFNQICQPWYDRVVSLKQENRVLGSIRDTLLPKLISGELRLQGPERFIRRPTC